jgi:hypothetical protein
MTVPPSSSSLLLARTAHMPGAVTCNWTCATLCPARITAFGRASGPDGVRISKWTLNAFGATATALSAPRSTTFRMTASPTLTALAEGTISSFTGNVSPAATGDSCPAASAARMATSQERARRVVLTDLQPIPLNIAGLRGPRRFWPLSPARPPN